MYVAQAPPIPLPTNLQPSSVTVLEWDHIRKNNQWNCFQFYAPTPFIYLYLDSLA